MTQAFSFSAFINFLIAGSATGQVTFLSLAAPFVLTLIFYGTGSTGGTN